LRAILPAVLDLASLWSRPVQPDETLPRPSHRKVSVWRLADDLQ